MSIPVYVINLRRSAARRETISKLLDHLGVPFQVIEAVDGYSLSKEEIAGKVTLTWNYCTHIRNLLPGEIGCTLSHFGIYERMVRENIEAVCILEDDAVADEDFRSLYSEGFLHDSGWDILFIGHHSICSKGPTAVIKRLQCGKSGLYIAQPVEIPVGSYGYVINKRAAEEILRHGYPVRKPLDFYIGNASALGLAVKVVSPPCIHHNYSVESTIYNEKEIVFGDNVLESLRRMVRKTYKWLPWLRDVRIMTAVYSNELVILMRKVGLLSKNYANF
jgi:glycosyl transferase family 25